MKQNKKIRKHKNGNSYLNVLSVQALPGHHETYSFRAKKSLGQNFLKSGQALNTMCSISDLNNNDIVIEIGPGKGALTKKLIEAKTGKIIAIEKDSELFSYLEKKFKEEIKNNKLILISGDILKLNLHDIFLKFFSVPRTREDEEPNHSKNLEICHFKYKIIANIPYNITGAILKKFLSLSNKPSSMTLLVQKEVAERIVAHDKKESILSLSVKAYGNPTYIMKVHKRFFSPSPKVDSAIITIKNISTKNFKTKKEEDLFFQIIKSGFAHKRKVLINNLLNVQARPGHLGDYVIKIFEKLKIDPKTRAEDVKLETWLKIMEEFYKNS